MKISPSILSGNFLDFASSIEQVKDEAGFDSLHIDVMDGNFVPNITMGVDLIKAIKAKYPKVPLDVHLMIINPEKHIDSFIEAGADSLSFHLEASLHPERLLQYIKQKNIKAGIAINPATGAETLKYIAGALDFVLVMSVNPGFSGQKFIDSTYQKIKELLIMKKKGFDFKIHLDGGVNINNVKQLSLAGVDAVVAGNAVFGDSNPQRALQNLYLEANK